MIQLIVEGIARNGPTVFGFIWMAWWARRRMAQCEERCARELERIIALLPASEPPPVTFETPVPVLEDPIEPPALLPVARVHVR